ncbi:transposase [Bradyrhizobium sp. UNPF46]|uniref:transposase n=1 Tax=Bradyrhizobium sp. UNPF46 TaxID=1141168 RepID=UPI001FEE346F|nr:transposase [Bradyrhizobium sp. UNPF46]
MRNALAHAGKSGRRVVSAFIATAFVSNPHEPNEARSRISSGPSGPRSPASSTRPRPMCWPTWRSRRTIKLHSAKPIELLKGEIKRRTEVVGIFPNEDGIVRLICAILLEQSDKWAVQRARCMTLETIAPLSDDPTVSLPAIVS